jgi:hypothetical protein
MFCVHVYVLCAYKVVSTKTDFLYGLCKMTKFDTKIGLFAMYVFSFLHRAQRISVFHETLRDHVEYEDMHLYIFFLIFLTF